jgi:predicted ester cyclase
LALDNDYFINFFFHKWRLKMSEQNKAAVRRFIQKGLNEQNLDEFDNYYFPEVVNHVLPPNMPQGVEGTKMFASMFIGAFPNLDVTVDDLVAEGNKTVLRWTARGTHQGDLMGVPPTGKNILITGMAIDRFEDGRSVEHWEILDQLGMMQQLGVIPGPEAN